MMHKSLLLPCMPETRLQPAGSSRSFRNSLEQPISSKPVRSQSISPTSFSYAPQNRCNTSSTFQKEKNHFVHITPRKSQFFHFIKKYIPLRFIDIKYFCNDQNMWNFINQSIMRNYWRIILSLFLIGNALSVQAAVKSFTETFVLYTDSEATTRS